MQVVLRIVGAAEHMVQEKAICCDDGVQCTGLSWFGQSLISFEEGLPYTLNIFTFPQPLHALHLRVDLEQQSRDSDGVVL